MIRRPPRSTLFPYTTLSDLDPGDSQCSQATYSLNTARSSCIQKAVPEAIIDSQLSEPPAAPNPVSEQRIGPSGQQSRGRAARTQSPAVGAAAQRDKCRQPDAQHLQQYGQRRWRAIERASSQKQRFRRDPVPRFPGHWQAVRSASSESLPRESAEKVRHRGDRHDTERSQHRVGRAARPPQPGAGKTTFLNILSQYIPNNERLVTIEDAAELRLAQENIVRLETRPPNIEGQGAIRQRQLLINALRMRPDRIIMGEVRGDEAFDMLQAMNTGHEGSMTTIHANTPRDAISRLESMVAMGNMNMPEKSVRQQIAAAITIVVQASRMSDGTRKVTSVSEITGMEENVISMQEIFNFTKKGIGPDGKVIGVFQPTHIRPRFLERLRVSGIVLPPVLLDRETQVN